MSEITIHLNGLPPDLIPIPAPVQRPWWQEDRKTCGHAIHCLPLTMANSLGYLILSPDAFRVTWNGDWEEDVHVESLGSAIVDNHSALATFTVQPGFLVRTQDAGDFILIKSIANMRGAWFTAMDALIERLEQNRRSRREVIVAPHLIVRGTTGPAADRGRP